MKWLDWIKNLGNTRGRDALRDQVIGSDPTAGYRANRFYQSEVIINDLPLFTLWQGRMMLRSDPVVSFAQNVRNAALMVADVEVKAANGAVKKWVEEQWATLWNKHRRQLVAAKRFGFAALQITYKEHKGQLAIEGVKDFDPADVRALEHAGKVIGFNVKSVAGGEATVKDPLACWLTFNAEYSSPYGSGCLRRAYPPWYEKWMNHGSKKLTQQRMMKDAFIGDRITYPPNLLVEMPDGIGGTKRIPWKDVLREIVENRTSGGALTLPYLPNKDGTANMVEYEPPQGIPGGTDLFQWTDKLDEGIFMAHDVPMEIVKAAEVGSGFSGRSIPMMVVLSVCTEELTEIVQQVDQHALRPAAWLQFGGDPDFELKPKSLVESFAADAGGSPMGGGAIGGQPGQRPEMQQQPPQPAPPQQIPQRKAAQFDEGPVAAEIHMKPLAAARRRIKSAAETIAAIKGEGLGLEPLASRIEAELRALRPGLSADLSASMFGGSLAGMADIVAIVPEAPSPLPAVAAGPPATPPPMPPPAALLFPEGEPPGVRFPALADALETLRESPTAVGLDYQMTAAEVRQGAFAITGDLTEAAVADVRDILARTIETGGSEADFVDTVMTRLEEEGGPLSESHVAQIFRTNTATATSNAQERALSTPLVVDAFPYRAYWATTDQRVRVTHRTLERQGLDGTNIYRADDPTWRKFRPPWEYNCRCSWSPVTVEQAAARGVTEAKEWLARAAAMAAEFGGTADEYLSRTAPGEPQFVVPPPFEPPPEFVR